MFDDDEEEEEEIGGLEGSVLVEEWSTDSFQNLLFSLIAYWWVVLRLAEENAGVDGPQGALPKKMIVVSHEFKRARFMDLHIPALKMSRQRVEFVGIDPPWEGERREEMMRGERERGYMAWESDLYGVGEVLDGKRRDRGWDEEEFVREMLGREKWVGSGMAGDGARDKLVEMVRWKGGEDGIQVFEGEVPWGDGDRSS